MKKKALAILLAGTILTAATTAYAEKSGVWGGVDIAPSARYLYIGAVTAISGQNDISTESGWLLRGDAGYGVYDYNTVLAGPTNANIDGDIISVDGMFGYRHFFDNGNNHITVYAGAELQNHDISPRDPANSVRGSEFGGKGSIELTVTPVEDISVNVIGIYSSAFSSYWTRGFLGYDMSSVTIGPEARFLGNDEFSQRRLGLTVTDIDLGVTSLTVSGGFANTTGNGDDGGYGNIGFSSKF